MSQETKIEPIQLSKAVADLVVARKAHQEEAQKKDDRLHQELWDKVYEENPQLDKNAPYKMNIEFAEQGVVMLTEAAPCDCGSMPKELLELLGEGVEVTAETDADDADDAEKSQ